MRTVVVVRAEYDSEARVWWTAGSDLFGVNAEAPTLEALGAKLPGVVGDMIEASGEDAAANLLIEVIAHASTSVRLAA
jgi:hypothetical protein